MSGLNPDGLGISRTLNDVTADSVNTGKFNNIQQIKSSSGEGDISAAISDDTKVELAPGSFTITEDIATTGLSNCKIEGGGRGVTTLQLADSVTADIFDFVDPEAVTISDLTLRGAFPNTPDEQTGNYSGVRLEEPNRVTVENVAFENWTNAGLFSAGNVGGGVDAPLTVTRCVFDNVAKRNRGGIYLNTSYAKIINNDWVNNIGESIVGIKIDRANHILKNNYISGVKQNPVLVTGSTANPGKSIISGNQINHNNNSNPLIHLQDCRGMTVVDNHALAVGSGHTIYLDGAYKNRVSGNLLENGSDVNDIIRIENSANNNADGNVIRDNDLSPQGNGANAVNEVSGDYNRIVENRSYSSTVGFSVTGTNSEDRNNDAIDLTKW